MTEGNDMQSSTPILGRTSNSARKHARRPQNRRVLAPRSARAGIAKAFRRMANGVVDKAAYASTVGFYRSGGQAWTKQLD
jgi:hypothetical protein